MFLQEKFQLPLVEGQLMASGFDLSDLGATRLKTETSFDLSDLGATPVTKPSQSMGRSFARGARNVAAGLMEVPDLLATPIRAGLNMASKALGSDYEFRPMSENIAQGIDKATKGYTAPQSDREKTEEAITRSLASLPVGGVLGKGIQAVKGLAGAPYLADTSKMQQLGKVLTGSNAITPGNLAGTAAASGLMQQQLNENPEDLTKAMIMGTLGGIGGGIAGGSLSALSKAGRQNLNRTMGEKFGQMTGIQPNRVEDFYHAGVDPMLTDVTNSKILKNATHGLEYAPYAGPPITNAKAAQKKAILEGLNTGEALERKEAGELAIKGAKAYKKSKDAIHNPMFEKIESDLERMPDTHIKPTKTFDFFDKLTKKNKNGLMDKKFLKTPVGQELQELKQAASIYGGEIPYDHLKLTLEGINDKITTHGLIGKSSQGRLKKLAEVISDDMEHSLEHKFKELGGDSYSNWKEAKKLYRDYATNDIPDLNQMFKKDKKGTINVFEDMVSNNKLGGERAKLALSGLNNKEQVELATAYQKRLGSQDDGTFSLARWGTNFRKLGKDAQEISLSPLNKEAQHKVHAIANVVDHLKDTLAEANSSKTAYHTAVYSIASAGVTAAGKAMAGNFAPAAILGSGLLLGRIGAKALTNPKIINWAYQGMRSKDLSHFMRHLDRLEHMGGIHRTIKTEAQRFANDINQAR